MGLIKFMYEDLYFQIIEDLYMNTPLGHPVAEVMFWWVSINEIQKMKKEFLFFYIR